MFTTTFDKIKQDHRMPFIPVCRQTCRIRKLKVASDNKNVLITIFVNSYIWGISESSFYDRLNDMNDDGDDNTTHDIMRMLLLAKTIYERIVGLI